MNLFTKLTLVLPLLVVCSCGGGGGSDNGPTALAPRIASITANPEVICVGGASDIAFTLLDSNQDSILWGARLSTDLHGELDQTSGSVAAGSTVTVRFKAARSGRHRHRVTVTVHARDSGGLEAEPVMQELFVFNC